MASDSLVTVSLLSKNNDKIKEELAKKIDVQQDVADSGKLLGIDTTGSIVPVEAPSSVKVSAESDNKIETKDDGIYVAPTDLSDYAKSDEIPDVSNFVEKEDGKGLFSGSYNDLTDQPTIPSTDGLVSEETLNTILTDYAKTDDLPSEYDDTAISDRITANEEAIAILNGVGEGSVSKTVDDALNKFATELSDDGVVNTYKELIDYADSHSSDVAEMVADIVENTTAIGELNTKVTNLETSVEDVYTKDETYSRDEVDTAISNARLDSGDDVTEISKADYDLLSEEEKKGRIFYIYDDEDGTITWYSLLGKPFETIDEDTLSVEGGKLKVIGGGDSEPDLLVTCEYTVDDSENFVVSNVSETFETIHAAIEEGQNVILKAFPIGTTENPYILYVGMSSSVGVMFSLMVGDDGQISALSIMILPDDSVIATRREYNLDGDADTVNGHTIESDVPAYAKFTDTVYDDTEIKKSIENKVEKEEGKGLFSGKYEDLTGTPVIPSIEGLVSEETLNITLEDYLDVDDLKIYHSIDEVGITTPCTLYALVSAMGRNSVLYVSSVNSSIITDIPTYGSLKVDTSNSNAFAYIFNTDNYQVGYYIGQGQFRWQKYAKASEIEEINNSLSSLLTTKEIIINSVELSANSSTPTLTIDATLDGYKLLGVIGYDLNNVYISASKIMTVENTVQYALVNRASYDIKINPVFYCLYTKN